MRRGRVFDGRRRAFALEIAQIMDAAGMKPSSSSDGPFESVLGVCLEAAGDLDNAPNGHDLHRLARSTVAKLKSGRDT